MKRVAFQILAPALAVALAAGLFLQVRTYAAEDDSAPFHARVRQAVERIPVTIGSWGGTDRQIPAAAGKLLKPNAMFCRNYRNSATGRHATVLLVHCRDSRDMTGHYPPVCYPSHGWTMAGAGQPQAIRLWGRDVPVVVYQFSRSELNRFVECVIYNFFVLPKDGLATDMRQVVAASADFRARPYGAAQLQVIFEAGMPESQRLDAIQELLGPLGPVIDTMQMREGTTKP